MKRATRLALLVYTEEPPQVLHCSLGATKIKEGVPQMQSVSFVEESLESDCWLNIKSRLVGYSDIVHPKVPHSRRAVAIVVSGKTFRLVDLCKCCSVIRFGRG